MKKKLYLHVGFHKTGTTSLQQVLRSHETSLARNGIRYFHGASDASHSAAWSLDGQKWGWKNRGARAISPRAWHNLVDKIKENSIDSCVSSEFFSQISLDKINKIREDLQATDVKIIFTWRPLQDLLASSYQQYLKFGITASFDDWLHSIFDVRGESRITPTFWSRHLHGDVIERWVSVFGADNAFMIVVDPEKPDFIYRQFAQIMEIDENILTETNRKTTNVSLNASEVSLLRTINEKFPRDLGWNRYEESIRLGAINALSVDQGSRQGKKLELPLWVKEPLIEIQTSQQLKIAQAGISILGNMDLAISREPDWGSSDLPSQVSVESAATMLVGSLTPDLSVYSFKMLVREIFTRIWRKIRNI